MAIHLAIFLNAEWKRAVRIDAGRGPEEVAERRFHARLAIKGDFYDRAAESGLNIRGGDSRDAAGERGGPAKFAADRFAGGDFPGDLFRSALPRRLVAARFGETGGNL